MCARTHICVKFQIDEKNIMLCQFVHNRAGFPYTMGEFILILALTEVDLSKIRVTQTYDTLILPTHLHSDINVTQSESKLEPTAIVDTTRDDAFQL